MRKDTKYLILMIAIIATFCYTGIALAESDMAIGGGDAEADLDFQIVIPTILYLQIGTTGATEDTITFNIDDIPGTGAIAGTSSGANPVPVRAAGFVPDGSTMTLEADSSTALTDGTNTIPFDEISWTATGDFTGGTFSNAADQQLDQWNDSGNRTGTYSFSYDNDTYYPASTYSGTVTYTLSCP